ncbi:E3 SUMO-protein ligase ZBED1-like [Argopecten irradians]|uniref:E3 SUMO-protein ligase ZBED1-like n=1 Tax=Argopecten irradians TaxID=31199 RepID=UPI0037235D14
MMVRYLEQQPAITATLMSGDVRKHVKDLDTLREVDITNLEDAVSILKDMKDITAVLCDEKQPTVSLICPMKYKILKSMELVAGTEFSVIRQLKVAIQQNMKSRYNNHEVEQFLLISSALDPRFKSLPQLDDIHRQELHDVIIQKVLTQSTVQPHIKTEPVEDEPQPESTPETQPTLPTLDLMPSTSQLSSSQDSGISDTVSSGTGSTIKNLFGDVFITGTEPANKTPLNIATGEVQSYFSEPTPPLACNPLKW